MKGIGPPPLAILNLRVLILVPIWGWVIFSMVRCSFAYPWWTGTACYSLLTWAETKWVRQLIIHGTIISSINMVITGISRGISQLQITLTRRRIPQGEIIATPRTLRLILWDPVMSECFSWGLWELFVSHMPKNVSQCQRKLKLPHNCTHLTC